MRLFILCLVVIAGTAQEHPPTPSSQASAAMSLDDQGKSVIVIDPKARAIDFAQAFDFLRKDKPTLKIMIRTNNSLISNVTDVIASTGGTLLLIKTLSSQGVKTQVLPVEQIMEISYSP